MGAERGDEMRVLVCGSRDWTDQEVIYETIRSLPDDTVIVCGDASGADYFARNSPRSSGITVFIADWGKYGKRAGPRRNQAMLDSGVDLVLAFSRQPVTPGTADMLARARKAGVPTFVWWQP